MLRTFSSHQTRKRICYIEVDDSDKENNAQQLEGSPQSPNKRPKKESR